MMNRTMMTLSFKNKYTGQLIINIYLKLLTHRTKTHTRLTRTRVRLTNRELALIDVTYCLYAHLGQ